MHCRVMITHLSCSVSIFPLIRYKIQISNEKIRILLCVSYLYRFSFEFADILNIERHLMGMKAAVSHS